MKVNSIIGRRKRLQSIYSAIDSEFETPKHKQNKDAVKIDHFIASLKRVTSKFTSKKFLKKPLQEMLKDFHDPSMDIDDEEDDMFFTLQKGSPQ